MPKKEYSNWRGAQIPSNDCVPTWKADIIMKNQALYYANIPPVETECHVCGEKKICMTKAADRPEAETGYVDEFSVCAECAENEGYDR